MARPDGEKTDGLEIISIGALYDGPWDKKYWSSSRGKDRYPHPVGYQAIRTHNGITYKMEILEGLKGPLFTINSTDGHSCSGQTPEIAWESFQKKGCSRLKVWRGKRFSGKVDGVEFFGLKNPYVQRLLRELVANGNGTAEPRLLSTPICNETTRTKHNTECTEPGTSPDLSPCILKPAVAVKSRKHKISNVKSDSKVSLKRPKPENQNQRVDASSSTQRTERNHIHGSSFTSSASKKEKESPQYLMPTLEAVNVTEDKKHLVRSEDIEEQEESPSKTVEKDREISVPNDQAINDMDLCAPDTLDLSLDDTSNVVVDIPKESPHDVKYEVLAAQKVISEDLATDSPPEAETIASTANENSEKNEHDSIGGDVANSMMTVLLPKALPLLKTFSRKKKVKTRAQEKSNRPDQSADIVGPVGLHIARTDLCSRVSTFGDVTSVAPDSFENDQLENPVTDESRLSKGVAEGDQTTIGACQGSAARHIETNDSKINSCSKVQLDSRFFDFGDIASVAPDSYEYDQCENPESDRSPLFQDVAVGDQTTEATAGKRDAESIGMEISVQMSQEDISLKTRKDNIDNPLGQCNVPLSESIICRNFPDVCAPEIKREPFGDNARLDPPPHNLHMAGSYVNSEDALCNMGLVTLQSKEVIFVSNCNDASVFSDSFISSKMRSRAVENNIKHDNESNNLQLVGCYLHPMPISLVLLCTKGKETYICVLSGLFVENRTLFIYKVPIEGKMKGSPSFIGHASISLPVSRDAFGREIALDSKSLQLTPDGQCLVLLNCIKAPYCSELKIHCPCSACTSDCFEKNAVKVVQVKQGYVSVVVKLKTTDRVRCILVCVPNYLLAADEGRRLYLWLMNSTWSAQTEECDLPMSDLLTPYIVELKKIPNYAALVVGHNGFGEFILWDISKRIQVSRFSAPSVSVSWVIPVSLFRWKNAGIVPTGRDEEEHINDLIDQIKMYAKRGENHDICPLDGDDVAIWLLISTVPDPDLLHYPSSDCQNNPAGCWKLALLVKNIVILGNALDPSAFAIGTSLDHGIVGTCDGQVYMWELSTGMKLGHLHSFKDGVSCIATGESTSSGAVAVAGDGGQLRLYIDRSSARDSAT